VRTRSPTIAGHWKQLSSAAEYKFLKNLSGTDSI
jgi:hypothetical protein